MRVDDAGGGDQAFCRDQGGVGVDDQFHVVDDVGVARPPHPGDPPVLDPDVGLAHPQHRVDDDDVADQHVQAAVARRPAGREHAVAHGLPAAAENLVAVGGVVALGLPPPGRCRPGAPGRPPSGRTGRRTAGARSQAPSCPRPVGALDQSPEPVGDPAAGQRDQAYPAALPGVPPDRGPRGDIQPHAQRLRTVEPQRRVGLEEVIMRRNKHRFIAGVRDIQLDRGAARVHRDRPLRRGDRTRGRGMLARRGPADRVIDGYQRGAAGEQGLYLQVPDNLRAPRP